MAGHVDFITDTTAESRLAANRSLRRMQHAAQVSDHPWHGMAFLIEAVVLLGFIAVAIAVFFRLFAYSESISSENTVLSNAVVYASNAAEQFCIDPESMAGYEKIEGDNYRVHCNVSQRATGAGTLYDATITVSDASTGEELYTLTTSDYVSGVS